MEGQIQQMKFSDHLKKLILIGSIPLLFFWLALGVSNVFYSDNIPLTQDTIMYSVISGAVIAIAVLLWDTHKIIKSIIKGN